MTPIDTEHALTFFLGLLLGHFVGDFVLQPYWLVLAKRDGWPGLFIHVGVVTFVTAILVWGTIANWWVWVIVLFLIHLFIDQFRTFIFTNNSKGKGLLLLFADQLAHVLSVMVIAWAATGWTPDLLQYLHYPDTPNQYRMMIYLTALAVLISTTPVLEAEITVAVWAAQGKETDKTVRIDTEDRIFGSIERIAAAILILSGLPVLAPLLFFPRLAVMVYKGYAREDKTAVTTKMVVSFVTTMLVCLMLASISPPVIFL